MVIRIRIRCQDEFDVLFSLSFLDEYIAEKYFPHSVLSRIVSILLQNNGPCALKKFTVNLSLMLGSLLLVFLFFEILVFRFIFIAPDIPTPVFVDGVIKHKPNQTGVMRIQNEIRAEFRINADGWNSGHADYATEKTKPRVLIIGDSYIEGLRVDYDKSVAEELERMFKGLAEVYRLGISGAPLSQYLHMLRKEALQYDPDYIVFNVVHNDFTESYLSQVGYYASSFMKLHIENGLVQQEIPPTQIPTRWYNFIRKSAVWRALAYRYQIRLQYLYNNLLAQDEERFEGNIDTQQLRKTATVNRNEIAVRYILDAANRICRENNSRLLVMMDAVRSVIYAHPEAEPDYTAGALSLNELTRDICNDLDVPFIDLHPVFLQEYRRNRQPFEFEHDGHWNRHANIMAARALHRHLQRIAPHFGK